MFNLYFNERTQVFTIIPMGDDVSVREDGYQVFRGESVDELRGIAKGLMAARFCSPPLYEIETLTKAMQVRFFVNEKIAIAERPKSHPLVFSSNEEALAAGLKPGAYYEASANHSPSIWAGSIMRVI